LPGLADAAAGASSTASEADLKRAIEEAMPPRSVVKWRKRVEPVKNEWRLCYYVFKAKVKGHTKKVVLVNDLYRHKRPGAGALSRGRRGPGRRRQSAGAGAG
jgi:hypothetical protein